MRIKNIEIDGFGVWQGLALEDLADRATVVFGPNEAGKTTLMQFVRAVLYGFTPDRRKKYLPPVHGGEPGGRLLLANEFGSFSVLRRANLADDGAEPEQLEIIDDRGEPREASQLDALLAGIDEPTYSNVFAVGLKEIQELGSLDDTAAADYLYRLTSGLDRVSLVDVIREVETARQRLLATADDQPSQIPQLLGRRDKLRSQIADLARQTQRWNELAGQRHKLIDEAAQLDRQIAQIEAAGHVLRAALDVQGPWQLRADVERQLEILKEVRPLPQRSVERLDAASKRLAAGRKRLKKLRVSREALKTDQQSLEVNTVLLNHAGRIESLHDQSQWIIGLEDQIARLREEVRKLDGDIEAAVTGYRSVGNATLDELPRETVSVLRRPSQLVREENDKLETARQEADEAKRALDAAIEQYEQVSRTRHLPDLGQAIQQAGTKVSLLRKRIQVEERIDQLSRRRQELEIDSDDLHTFDQAPLRITVLVGALFAVGAALVMFGIVGGLNAWIASGWPYAMFGFLMAGLAIGGKLLLERHTDEHVSDNFRHLGQLRGQLADAKRERDELDAELPAGGGSLDARLREAEIELQGLERLIPIRTEREQAEQRHLAAQRRFADAQEAVRQAKQRWKGALRSVGLPEDFAPPKVKQVVRSNEQVLELRRRRDARKDELDQRERELLLVNNRLQQILDDVRLTCTSDRPIERIRELVQAVAKEKETLALRDDLDKRLRRLARHRDKIVSLCRKASRQRHALLTLAGVENEKGFRQAAADWSRVCDLKRQHAELTVRIQTTLSGHRGPLAPREEVRGPLAPRQDSSDAGQSRRKTLPLAERADHNERADHWGDEPFSEDDIAAVFRVNGPDVKSRWDEQQRQLTEIRVRLAQIHERRGACTHEMQSLAADRQMGKARLELGTVEVQLADAIRRWKVLAIIGRLLEAVRLRYETDRQPQTLREASQYLVRLTGGAYTRVWMPLDRRGLLVENDMGQSLSLDVLSRGTREAVFIGLRLALAGSFASRGATLPLVLDDVLVNFDSERVRCAAEVLCDFARQGHQVLMFTCHEHITDIFEEAQADVRVLPARDGSVRQRRKRLVAELPPPTPPAVPEEPEPVRISPEVDPNPFFQEAAAEEEFDPVYPLPPKPEKPKRERKKKLVPKLPDYWPLAELPATQPAASVEPAGNGALAAAAESFEVLAFRYQAESDPEPRTLIISGPDESPPAPKHLSRRRERFAWESPEMYWDG